VAERNERMERYYQIQDDLRAALKAYVNHAPLYDHSQIELNIGLNDNQPGQWIAVIRFHGGPEEVLPMDDS
jgi:hypothetical protein